jgi:hypothetical protein
LASPPPHRSWRPRGRHSSSASWAAACSPRQLAIGIGFGPDHRYEIAAFIHHTSNGDLRLPNWGLTYSGILLRVPLP